MVAAWNRNKNQQKNMSWSGKRQHRAFTGELWKSKAKEITSGKPKEIQITKTSQSELEEAEETPVTGARSRKTCNRYQAWDFKHITGAKRGNSMQSKLRFVCLCCILLLIVFSTPPPPPPAAASSKQDYTVKFQFAFVAYQFGFP